MEETRKRMKFEILLERYFSNFARILLTNLLFFVPFGLLIGLCCFLQTFVQGMLFAILSMIAIIFVFPFYAGVTLVCRDMARGDEKVKIFSTYIKGVKENYKSFFLYGVIVSLVTLFSYFSISIYSKLLSSSWLFYVALFVCILIALAVLFTFFYVPIMTVTFDLSVKHILKNSFLMSFGEIKNNFFALIALAVVLAISLTIVAFCSNPILLIVMTLLLLGLVVPASCQFVISFFVYDDMYGSIAQRDAKSEQLDKAIAEAKDKRNNTPVVEDYSDVDISSLKDTDDYIFYKGKMIKQSVLLKLALEQRAEKSPESKEN